MAIIVLPRAASQRAQRDMRWSGGSSFFQRPIETPGAENGEIRKSESVDRDSDS